MKLRNSIALLVLFFFMPFIAMSQSTEGGNQDFLLTAILIVLALMVIVLFAVIYSLSSLRRLMKGEEQKTAVAGQYAEEPTGLEVLWNRLWDRKPIEEEKDILLDHNYDGIRELDNHLPPWWSALFYASIVFGVIYLLIYHVFDVQPLSAEEYNISVTQAEEAATARQASLVAEGGGFDESAIEFTDDPLVLSSGKEIYERQCAACHLIDGGGSIGPNLTDEYWLHGGSMIDIFNTVKVGVPDKGMISWEPVLSPEQMRDVSAFIMSLKGSTPANPKAPQGAIYAE